MSVFELIMISISLASDAFAVAFSKGISIKNIKVYHAIKIGLYFGTFQALMPYIGYLLSNNLSVYLIRYSHLISFIILFIIGLCMIKENIDSQNDILNIKTMIPLSIGTSIDALAVGLTLSLMVDNIISSCLIIGIITFFLSLIAVIFANKIKDKIKVSPQKFGGLILIFISLKMLIEFIGLN